MSASGPARAADRWGSTKTRRDLTPQCVPYGTIGGPSLLRSPFDPGGVHGRPMLDLDGAFATQLLRMRFSFGRQRDHQVERAVLQFLETPGVVRRHGDTDFR